jgi:hypothetical protein
MERFRQSRKKKGRVMIMVFTKNSALVKTWVSLVLSGAYTKDEVPKLFNLREVVGEVVDSLT